MVGFELIAFGVLGFLILAKSCCGLLTVMLLRICVYSVTGLLSCGGVYGICFALVLLFMLLHFVCVCVVVVLWLLDVCG